MSEVLSFQGVARSQVLLLQGLTSHLARKVLTGTSVDLEALFQCQERLEHWLQYLSPVGQAMELDYDEAPAPFLTRPAPPLASEPSPFVPPFPESLALDGQRPRVQFPPEPFFASDLESTPEGEP